MRDIGEIIERGKREMLDDEEKELLSKLPLFPHKRDGTRLSIEELENLSQLIRKSIRKKKGIKPEKEEPFFGQNIKEAYHVIKGMFKKGYKT